MRAVATALGRALARGMAFGRAGTRPRDTPRVAADVLRPMGDGQVVSLKDEPSNLLLTYIPVRVPVRERDGDLREGET